MGCRVAGIPSRKEISGGTRCNSFCPLARQSYRVLLVEQHSYASEARGYIPLMTLVFVNPVKSGCSSTLLEENICMIYAILHISCNLVSVQKYEHRIVSAITSWPFLVAQLLYFFFYLCNLCISFFRQSIQVLITQPWLILVAAFRANQDDVQHKIVIFKNIHRSIVHMQFTTWCVQIKKRQHAYSHV